MKISIKSNLVEPYQIFSGMSYQECAKFKDIITGNEVTISDEDEYRKDLIVYELMHKGTHYERLFFFNFIESEEKEVAANLLREYLKNEKVSTDIQYTAPNIEMGINFIEKIFNEFGYKLDRFFDFRSDSFSIKYYFVKE